MLTTTFHKLFSLLTFRNVSKDPGQFKICWTWPPAIRDDPYAYLSVNPFRERTTLKLTTPEKVVPELE